MWACRPARWGTRRSAISISVPVASLADGVTGWQALDHWGQMVAAMALVAALGSLLCFAPRLQALQAELQARHGLGEGFAKAMREREEELRREARAAAPPVEKGPFRPPDLVDVAALD